MSAQNGGRKFLISLAVMSATVMQVLDTTIVNVALPHMQGALATTPDEISWVLTSYLVASGVLMPLTGYFTDRLGQRKYLLISIFGFVLSSMLCGIAGSLTEIVLFRLLQGAFGAALVPLSQSIMAASFPQEERGRAMAIWGIGVMVGPILGPTLGGYLTEVLSWRWTFFINAPVGVMSLLLAWYIVPETDKRERQMDWAGLVLMTIFIGGLQFVLDRGNRDDWFNSNLIQLMSLASVAGLGAFVYHAISHPHPIFDLRLFRDRNFTTANLLLFMFGLGLFGVLVLQPMMLEGLLGYPASTAGWTMAPRGAVSMVSMMIVGRIINRVPAHILIGIGIVLCAIGSFAMTDYSLYVNQWFLIWPVMVQGFGLGMMFVPLSTVAFTTLPKAAYAEAAGLFSLTRTIGASIGISIVATVMTRETQVAWNEIGAHIQPFNPALEQYLARLGLDSSDPQAAAVLAQELGRQAQMIGLVDAFMLVAWSFVVMFPLVLLLRGKRAGKAAG